MGAARRALAGAHWRRSVSEGFLLLKVSGNLGTERSWRGGERRGERSGNTRAVREGLDNSLDESGVYGVVTWMEAGGGRQVTWGRVLWHD